jgi:hypothetical protein
MNHTTVLITDTRKEAVKLEDMVSRSLTKNKTLNILEHYIDDIGMNPDKTFIDTNIFAGEMDLYDFKNMLSELENICEHTGTGLSLAYDGFNNDMVNPIPEEQLSQILNKFKTVMVDTMVPVEPLENEEGLFQKDPNYTVKFDATIVTKKLIMAAGSPSRSLYIQMGELTLAAREGMLLKHIYYGSPTNHKIEIIPKYYADKHNYKILSDKEKLKHNPF